MINLVRNELIKMVHKPGLYVLLILIIIMTMIGGFTEKTLREMYGGGASDSNIVYEDLEEHMKSYDLNTDDGLYWYVNDKNSLDFYKLSKNYVRTSPEYYFIDQEIMPQIECMNANQYINKDDILYNECKASYELLVKKLDNFDWKKDITDSINEKNKELDELKNFYSLGEIKESDYESGKDMIEFELELLNYRLKYEIPFSYNQEAYFLDSYTESYVMYSSMNPDENSYTSKEKLNAFREAKAEYFVNKYIVENDKISGEYDTDAVATNLKYSFSFYGATFLIIALVVIFGGMISDEISKGTIKQLLIKPYTRTKILSSKLIAGIIMFLIFAIMYALVNIVIYGAFTGGIASLFENSVVYNFSTNSAVEINNIMLILLNFVCIIPMFIIVILFILFVNVITSNSVASIISGFVLYMGSVLVIDMGYLSDSVTANAYLPIVNWDFSYYLFGGNHWLSHCNLTLSIIVTVVTILILTIATYLIFNYKDIKNQ